MILFQMTQSTEVMNLISLFKKRRRYYTFSKRKTRTEAF